MPYPNLIRLAWPRGSAIFTRPSEIARTSIWSAALQPCRRTAAEFFNLIMPAAFTSAPLRPSSRATLDRWLPRALAAASIAFILLFLYTALRRMQYPFSFDQVEGGMVTSVWRIAHGLPLYVKPSQDFVPFLYAPLFFYLAAAVAKITGVGYAALRLVSTLGTLGCFAVIFAIVYSETRSRLAAIAGAGLYAACYMPLEAWFDLGRVDSLFVFLLLLAIYCTRRAPVLLAVLVWLIAFQVKQTVLPVAILVICADWQRPRRLAIGLSTLLAGFAACILVMNHFTGGWYSYYLFGTSQGLPWLLRSAVLYIPTDLLQPFGLGALILLACLCFAPPRIRSTSTQHYLFVSISIYASIWYLRAHGGSSLNTLMPAYAWSAVLFGTSLGRLGQWLDTLRFPQIQICRILLLTAATIQIVGFFYHPSRFYPARATRDQRQAFENQLHALPGDIYVINHSYDAILAGKQPHAVIDAFGIIQDSPPSPLRTAFLNDFQHAVDAHVYNGFVLDATADTYKPGAGWMPADFLAQYPVRLLAKSNDIQVNGQPVEQWIYLPCSALDSDTSKFITPDLIISYGSCANAPSRPDSHTP